MNHIHLVVEKTFQDKTIIFFTDKGYNKKTNPLFFFEKVKKIITFTTSRKAIIIMSGEEKRVIKSDCFVL